MARVMEDSMYMHDESQWEGLEEMMARSTAGEVAIPELEMVAAEETMMEEPMAAFHPGLVGQGWGWSCTASEMAAAGRELVRHSIAVTGAGGVATGRGGAGTSRRPPRPRLPRTADPPLDVAGLRRPRQR